jgi:hypothetical protein
MSFKKLGMALLAVVVLGAIAANSAFAANEYKETGGAWYTGASPGTKLAEGSTKTLTTTAVGTQKLQTTVATSPLDITATGVECVSCVIKNTGSTATIDGTLKFTSVTVSEPTGCSVEGGTVTTKALTAVLGMKNGSSTIATLKFSPESGTTFATVVLTGTSCPIAGTYKVTGSQFAEATNATGVFAASQEIKLSAAIQEQAGEAGSLKFGANAAVLTGALKGSIGGTEWAGKEK